MRFLSCRRPWKHIREEQNEKTEKIIPLELLEKYSILNDMPLAFCVIELVFDANGRGVDFVFRYCNEEMAGYLCRRSFKR